ncbi:MAG: YicC family protein [Lachnospiraceae bacterium]|nr:YicC family protein [Lachnospiraceae bacterium]MBP3611178.1 YicC family protein [Lachnospiraceae bacterium]
MIKSMTGFGRYEFTGAERKITVEMKSVNHRYSEISIRMPKKLNMFETGIRNVLKQYISRGKVDMFITYEDESEGKACVRYNEDIAAEYLAYLKKMSETFGLENDIRVSTLSKYPEVLVLEEQTQDEDDIWHDLETAVRGCAEKFVQTRIDEGNHLKEDIIQKLQGILTMVDKVEERSPQIVKEYREKLLGKVAELLGDTKLDEAVLATEITIFADKICVDEETVRLRAHVDNMIKTLDAGENIGRKLDFIAQEMNREANTTLSKANDMELSGIAIDLKTEIEKIREQIQNIE